MAVTLSMPTETLAYIIEKAREFDAEVEVDDPDSGSNSTDDREVAILEDTSENPTEEELTEFLSGLNEQQMAELIALVWVGRGDFNKKSWSDALAAAVETRNARAVGYLMGTPMLGDLIEEGLAELGVEIPLPTEEAAA